MTAIWVAAIAAAAAFGVGVGVLLRPRSSPVAAVVPPDRFTRAELLQAIVDTADVGVLAVDVHRDVVFYNERARELGAVRDELIDEGVWDVASRVLLTGGECAADVRSSPGTTPWGSPRRATTMKILARLVGKGEETYAIVYALDDSEHVRMEETRRDFIANVSHELKTPVGAIGLLAEALLASEDDPDAVSHFGGSIAAEATRMGSMVTELIALSRLQGGEAIAEFEDVDVDELVAEAMRRARVSAQARDITVTADEPSGLVVRGDAALLVTALSNLIANAVAYSAPGSPVSVSRRELREDGRRIAAIAVTDRGIGIAPADQERVFERFFRVDPARSRNTGGTGLGLAIVKHVAANHGGSIGLWSRPGTGSTFTLKLALAESRRPPGGHAAAPSVRTLSDPVSDRVGHDAGPPTPKESVR